MWLAHNATYLCVYTHTGTRTFFFFLIFKLELRHYLVFTLLGLIQSRLFLGINTDALGAAIATQRTGPTS